MGVSVRDYVQDGTEDESPDNEHARQIDDVVCAGRALTSFTVFSACIASPRANIRDAPPIH